MPESEIRFNLVFYKTAAGNEPVLEWLRNLEPAYRKIIGDDLKTIQFGFPDEIPPKLCKSLGKGLIECRSDLPGRNIARIIFCVNGSEIVTLHAFIKKEQKTKPQHIELALERKRELGL